MAPAILVGFPLSCRLLLVKLALGGAVSDVSFEGITIEDHRTTRPLIVVHNGKYTIPGQLYGADTPYSPISGLRFSTITAWSTNDRPEVWIHDGEGGPFDAITFESVTINGEVLSASSGHLVLQGDPDLAFLPEPPPRRTHANPLF